MTERSLPIVPASRWWAGFVVTVGIALYMTWLAYHWELPDIFAKPYVDKVVHFSMGGLLAFFLDGALRRRMLVLRQGLAIPLAAAIVLVPAGIEEFLQRFSIARTSSIWDYAADVAGVVVLITIRRRIAQ